MTTTYTGRLRAEQRAGKQVVCSVAPYEGREVVYDPGYGFTHPKPWVLPGTGLRFDGRECHAVPKPKRSLRDA